MVQLKGVGTLELAGLALECKGQHMAAGDAFACQPHKEPAQQ